MEKIVVTRHRNLVKYLIEIKLVDKNIKVLTKAKIEDVEGKHVIGVLPHWLSSKAARYTELSLRLPSEKRHKELSLEDVRWYAKDGYNTYEVTEIEWNNKGGD